MQEDFEKERDEADELTDKAQQCSNAIEEIVDVSDTALTELISAVVPLLNILTMIAAKHPLGRFIVPIIATIGADLIERTNDTIVNTCRDARLRRGLVPHHAGLHGTRPTCHF